MCVCVCVCEPRIHFVFIIFIFIFMYEVTSTREREGGSRPATTRRHKSISSVVIPLGSRSGTKKWLRPQTLNPKYIRVVFLQGSRSGMASCKSKKSRPARR